MIASEQTLAPLLTLDNICAGRDDYLITSDSRHYRRADFQLAAKVVTPGQFMQMSRTDAARAKDIAWQLLTRPTPGAPRPSWDTLPRDWKDYERKLGLGIPEERPRTRKVGRPKIHRPPK
jgi:hypothetical protein